MNKGLVKGGIPPKRKDGYDGFMDKECIEVCNALNKLPGVETTESCCGHCKNPYRIWFKSVNTYSLGVIARAFDRRYSGTNIVFSIKVETNDAGDCPMYSFMIESKSAYSNESEMKEDINVILGNLNYWQDSRFDSHFGK
ncbi:MAG: hypothetical protein IKW84_08990 [Bacteroidaceae bacterium]|nr:hypothetical protein [Bacteroidaceae bacterium]MBR5159698.1 hypothetical protein [Bacteroidaceae bacterium]